MQQDAQTPVQVVQEDVSEGSRDRLAYQWLLSDPRGRRIIRKIRWYLGADAIGTVSGHEALATRDAMRAFAAQFERDLQTSDFDGWCGLHREYLDSLEAERLADDQKRAAQAAQDPQ